MANNKIIRILQQNIIANTLLRRILFFVNMLINIPMRSERSLIIQYLDNLFLDFSGVLA